MKRTIKLAVVAALALGATSAFATNGSALIGAGAKSRGMGGTGIGVSHGSESALSNPAMITSVEKTEISFGGTIFMPDVKNTNTIGMESTSSSASDLSVIPEVSIASKVTDEFYIGVGMWGTAGMGVDYRDANSATDSQMQMVTNLQLMQFGVPLAYKVADFSIAITPILQYGSLDINYVTPQNNKVGMGVAQDLQFGYNLGLSYEIADFTIGAVYKSQIDMEYKGFGSTVAAMVPTYTNDKLSTPAEIGLGVSYKMNEHTIAFDYKNIKWSDAKGYEDFAWDDQDVFALGYEYAPKGWAVRVGYNYASSPISNQTVGAQGTLENVQNTFNLLGFPAIIESHYTIGGSYNFSEVTSLDLAFAYAPETSEKYKNFMMQDIETKHSQTSLSAQMNFRF
jgi:long-chain fatty acid transport protein